MKSLRLLPMLCLFACDVPRPVEVYPDAQVGDAPRDPTDDPLGSADDNPIGSDDEDDDQPPVQGGGGTGTRPDAGRRDGGVDAGSAGSDAGKKDAGSDQSKSATSANALAGRYLMRVDRFETTRLSSSTTVKTRVSDLVLVDLTAKDGKLVGTETLCDRSYVHACNAGTRITCTMTTAVASGVKQKLTSKAAQVARTYTFDPATGALAGEAASLGLGFSDDGKALPDDDGDARLWKLDDGSGFARSVDLKHPLLTGTCEVSSAVRTKLTLSGALDPTKPSLDGAELTAEDAGSEQVVLSAEGRPTSQCTVAALSQPASDVRRVVRFKRLASGGTSCPASEQFESELPADPPG